MSACSAATFISYHSRLCLSTTFSFFYFLFSCAFGTHRSARDILPDVSTNVNNNLQLFLHTSFTHFFTQYSPCIRTGCINQLHGFIGSGIALTDCACYSYITVIYLKVSLLPEFRQPEFHRMMIRSPLQPPPAQPGTRTGMLPQEARPDTQAG